MNIKRGKVLSKEKAKSARTNGMYCLVVAIMRKYLKVFRVSYRMTRKRGHMFDWTLQLPREMTGGWMVKTLVEFIMGYDWWYKGWLRLWKMMILEW